MARDKTQKRFTTPSRTRMRNLRQYKDLSEEDFDKIWDAKITGLEVDQKFENRINDWMESFAVDYDLTDLKANDKLVLRALAQANITLDDLENYSHWMRAGGIAEADILKLEKINNMMSVLRKDISSMQNDLNITRRTRKGDKEESLLAYLENLKKSAKEFYQNRMFYVWCPKCNTLLFTGWFLFPNYETNKIHLTCKHKLPTGELCNHSFIVNSKKLLESRGLNKEDVPEFYK